MLPTLDGDTGTLPTSHPYLMGICCHSTHESPLWDGDTHSQDPRVTPASGGHTSMVPTSHPLMGTRWHSAHKPSQAYGAWDMAARSPQTTPAAGDMPPLTPLAIPS